METKNKQIKKTSCFAIASLIFGILAIPIAFFTGNPLGFGPLVGGLYVILAPLSIISGITALTQIMIFSRNRQGGIFIAVLGMVAALFSIFCFFIHYIDTFNY